VEGCGEHIRTDPEPSYTSRTPPRDKHANGIAERTVGIVIATANVALLALVPRAPQRYWDLAIMYACVTMAFNYNTTLLLMTHHTS
jgi:hypothetical protein